MNFERQPLQGTRSNGAESESLAAVVAVLRGQPARCRNSGERILAIRGRLVTAALEIFGDTALHKAESLGSPLHQQRIHTRRGTIAVSGVSDSLNTAQNRLDARSRRGGEVPQNDTAPGPIAAQLPKQAY
jgi:hypothetical protein